MIKHIYFSYAESEREAYSYLKYFFRSIGIWTQDEGQQPQDAIQINAVMFYRATDIITSTV